MSGLRTVSVCALALMTVVSVHARQTVTLALARVEIQVGERATAQVMAPAGAAVSVTMTGPAPIAPLTVTGAGSAQPVTLGPFAQPGTYTITATSGAGTQRRQASATLRVTWPDGRAPVVGARVGPSVARVSDALLEAINATRTSVSRLPATEPTIAETKAAIDELLQALADIRQRMTDAASTIDSYGGLIEQDTTASREAKDAYARIAREINQVLDQQAQQVAAFGRDAGSAPADPCMAAMAIATALDGARASVSTMQGIVQQFGREHANADGEGAEWRQMKTKIERLVATGGASSFGEAQRIVERATSERGLGGYSTRQCVKYTGEMSGSTHVEALDKGQPFYAQMNNWTARVELAAARTVTPGQDAPVRGVIRGEASDFKVRNLLRSLYADRPADYIEYLQSDPPPEQQAGASFVVAVEGTIRGTQMTLKLRPGGVDYTGRVTGKIAAVVIPMASPVPIVQTYDLPFQGGTWQLMRALGPDGTTERPFTIVVGGDKRLVQAEYPRTLTAPGARGNFTIKIRLCHGCGG
jgi:hypothetical protein